MIRSFRRPQNRNSAFWNGSNRNCVCTSPDRPSIPRRRSVYPQARYTGQPHLKSVSMTSAPERLPGSFPGLLPCGRPPAALHIGYSPPFPPLPVLQKPPQSTPRSLIPRPGTPSSASYSTWIPGSLAPRTIRLLAARSSGMLPLAGSTPPDAPDVQAPLYCVSPQKIYPAASSAMYYSRVHGTLLDSIVFSRFPHSCARHQEI